MLLLIFIYYLKGILSISDIQILLKPITEQFFHSSEGFNLQDIYEEVVCMEKKQVQELKESVAEKFHQAETVFPDAPEESQAFLKQFSFICMLGFDVYIKKLLIEKIIDGLETDENKDPKKEEN